MGLGFPLYSCIYIFILISYGMYVHQIYKYVCIHSWAYHWTLGFSFVIGSYLCTTPDLAMVNSKAFPGFCVSKAKSLAEMIKVKSTELTENKSIMALHFQVM